MTKRAKTKKKLAPKRSGIVPDLAASAEKLSIYVGNSAAADEADAAYARAEAWAKSPAGTPYGKGKR